MRSSKSRSRSKSSRSRSVGNIVNRVFDSSGPESKVRGTPQQIIDKYNQLARDAQLSNDRVAAENFQQHSEHYTRMLAEAQREQDARREQQERERSERQQQHQDGRPDQGGEQPAAAPDREPDRQPDRRPDRQPDTGHAPDRGDSRALASDVIDMGGSDDSGLVETPESKPAPKPRSRRPRKSGSAPAAGAEGGEAKPEDAGGAAEAAE